MDLFGSVANAATTLAPAVRNTAATGVAVDLQGFAGAILQAVVGTITDGTHTLTVEDADLAGGPWTAVPAANLQGGFAALATGVNQRVGYQGIRRWLRVNSASSGATGGAFAVIVLRGGARRLPA